jgi:hypothetical protein
MNNSSIRFLIRLRSTIRTDATNWSTKRLRIFETQQQKTSSAIPVRMSSVFETNTRTIPFKRFLTATAT